MLGQISLQQEKTAAEKAGSNKVSLTNLCVAYLPAAVARQLRCQMAGPIR